MTGRIVVTYTGKLLSKNPIVMIVLCIKGRVESRNFSDDGRLTRVEVNMYEYIDLYIVALKITHFT